MYHVDTVEANSNYTGLPGGTLEDKFGFELYPQGYFDFPYPANFHQGNNL